MPFKANFGFAALGAELEKVVEAFVEGALMGCLMAQIEQEALAVFADAVIAEDQPLEPEGAIAEPLMAGHVGDEQAFGFGGGLVLVEEVFEKLGEVFFVFGREDEECASESVAQIV